MLLPNRTVPLSLGGLDQTKLEAVPDTDSYQDPSYIIPVTCRHSSPIFDYPPRHIIIESSSTSLRQLSSSTCQTSSLLATPRGYGSRVFTGLPIANAEHGIPVDGEWIYGNVSGNVSFFYYYLYSCHDGYLQCRLVHADVSTPGTQPPNPMYWRFLARR